MKADVYKWSAEERDWMERHGAPINRFTWVGVLSRKTRAALAYRDRPKVRV